MKKLFLFVLFTFLLSACGSNNSDSDDSKVDSQSSMRLESRKSKGDGDMVKSIIVYYSLTGNTEAVAEEIHKQVDGELLRIETVESYPEVYDDVLAVVRSQRNNNNELPEIISKEVDFSEYDSIFIGAPIWFGEPALPVEKWISENDLSNKKIYPFFTSGSSPINESMARYKDLLNQSNISKGLEITSSNNSNLSNVVEEWLTEIKP